MIGKILVAIDFSGSSFNALASAVEIAMRNKATLHLVSVYEEYPESGRVTNAGNMQWTETLTAITADIAKKNDVECSVLFLKGFAGNMILQALTDSRADLIVMGMHGASGWRNVFTGSTAYYVIKNASCPVLIIPEGKKWIDFQKVLFPVRPIVGALNQYSFIDHILKNSKHQAQLEVMGLLNNRNEEDTTLVTKMTNDLVKNFTKDNVAFSLQFSMQKNIADGVLERAGAIGADLIVLSQTIDIASKRSFVGPFSQRIIHHAEVPLLAAWK